MCLLARQRGEAVFPSKSPRLEPTLETVPNLMTRSPCLMPALSAGLLFTKDMELLCTHQTSFLLFA